MKSLAKTIAVAAALVSLAGQTVASHASAFAAWQVANVPFGDTLNVRKYPSNSSQKQSAYPNGTVLQMTGKCTGGVDLDYINGWPAWRQAQAVRHEWCEAWVKPPGAPARTGWVYGRYIRPL